MIALLRLLACIARLPDAGTVAIDHTNTNVVTHVEEITTTTTTTQTLPATAHICAEKRSGAICTHAGIFPVAQFSPEGLPRTQSALYLPIDGTWNAWDGQLYIHQERRPERTTARVDQRSARIARKLTREAGCVRVRSTTAGKPAADPAAQGGFIRPLLDIYEDLTVGACS